MPVRYWFVLLMGLLLSACASTAPPAPAVVPPPVLAPVQPSLMEQNLLGAYQAQSAVETTRHASRANRSYKAVDIDQIPVFKQAFGAEDVAVVIGIEEYRSLPAVDYAYNDARLVKEYLLALGITERNIRFISNDGATLSAVKVALESWLPNVVKPGSRVVIFYSGHGSPEPTTGSAYLIPHDGDPNYLADTSYPADRLYQQLGRLPAAEVMVIMDACFSGVGERSVLAKGTRAITMRPKQAALPAKLVVLAAARDSETATAYDDKEHGLFTYYFLKGIKEGQKTIGDVYSFATPRVADEARRKNVTQTPNLNQPQSALVNRFQIAH